MNDSAPKVSNTNATTGTADRRVGRTRRMLSSSMLGLLESTPWKNLTVQNIADRANVGRSTFYSHFETKFDLLEAQLPTLEAIDQTTTLPDFVPLFDHVLKHAEVMKPILRQPIGIQVSDRMLKRLTEWWAQILTNHHADYNNDLTASFLAGATVASMRHYLDDTSASSPQQMADSLEMLVRNTLGLGEQSGMV